jgi:hypothetical protein
MRIGPHWYNLVPPQIHSPKSLFRLTRSHFIDSKRFRRRSDCKEKDAPKVFMELYTLYVSNNLLDPTVMQ